MWKHSEALGRLDRNLSIFFHNTISFRGEEKKENRQKYLTKKKWFLLLGEILWMRKSVALGRLTDLGQRADRKKNLCNSIKTSEYVDVKTTFPMAIFHDSTIRSTTTVPHIHPLTPLSQRCYSKYLFTITCSECFVPRLSLSFLRLALSRFS